MKRKKMWLPAVGIALALALIPVASGGAQAVRQSRPNLVHAQLGGRGLLFTLNYERYVVPRLGVGAGIMAAGSSDATVVLLPVFMSLNPVGDIHSLYLSPGAVLILAGSPEVGDFTSTVIGSVELGYQYQSVEGFFIRPAFELLFGGGGFIIWPAVSVGASF